MWKVANRIHSLPFERSSLPLALRESRHLSNVTGFTVFFANLFLTLHQLFQREIKSSLLMGRWTLTLKNCKCCPMSPWMLKGLLHVKHFYTITQMSHEGHKSMEVLYTFQQYQWVIEWLTRSPVGRPVGFPNNYVLSLHCKIKGRWPSFSLSKWKVHFLHISSFLDLAIFHNKFNFFHSGEFAVILFSVQFNLKYAQHRFTSLDPDE